MFGTIVVGIDGADKGRAAVRLASLLAGATGDRLMLVMVRLDPAIDFSQSIANGGRFRRELEQQLERVRDELAPNAQARIQAEVSAAHGLRIAATRERAGLVVVAQS